VSINSLLAEYHVSFFAFIPKKKENALAEITGNPRPFFFVGKKGQDMDIYRSGYFRDFWSLVLGDLYF